MNEAYISAGDWLSYTHTRIPAGRVQFAARIASNSGSSGLIEIRSGSRTGPILATVPASRTGGWQSWQTVLTDPVRTDGVSGLTLTFASEGSSDFANLNWLEIVMAPAEGSSASTILSESPESTPGPSVTPSSSTGNLPSPESDSGSPERAPAGPGGPGIPVGVPPGVQLTSSPGLTITTPGQVIDGLDIAGPVEVRAPGVLIRNSRIRGSGSGHGIYVRDGSVTVEDTEISGFANGISHSNWTARRVDIHSMTADGVKLGSNVLLEDSWIHDLTPAPRAHADGGQVQSGVTDTVVRRNSIEVGSADAALFIAPSLGPSSAGPLILQQNYLDGGTFTVQIVDGDYGAFFIDDIRFRDNSFGEQHRYGTHRLNVPVSWSGNTMFGSGEVVRE